MLDRMKQRAGEQKTAFTDLIGLKIEDVTYPGSGVVRIKLSNGRRIFMNSGSVFDQAGNSLEAK